MISDPQPCKFPRESTGSTSSTPRSKVSPYELAILAVAVALALVLGFSHLGAPSLWHDEAVQVLVAKNIAETGHAVLPSGKPHPVAPVFNAIMAAAIKLFGDAETVARSPSVVFAALNVCLIFFLVRTLLGRGAALVAAFALALSPWVVAWSREARFYTMQQTLYLVFLWTAWQALSEDRRNRAALWACAAGLAYLLGIGVSLHSLLFLGPVGAYAGCMILFQRRCKPRWLAAILLTAAAGGVTLLGYYALLPSHDAQVVFTAPTLDVQTGDPHQASHLYYIEWLSGNLSRGFFMLAVLGFALMLTRENHRGLYAALAFWVPIIALSLLAYRKHRFMFFAFPLYTAAFSYGLVLLARLVMQARKSTAHALLAGLILLFGLRLAVSAASLAHTSVAYARGADETLATRHPKFRTPCLYVRQHLQPDTVVLADTVVTALYYIGRVDNWYPAVPPWESWETGMVGLKDLDELQAYVAAYPKGFFIAEWYRFDYAPELSPARDWVKTHMKRIDQACTGDVTLYAWGVP